MIDLRQTPEYASFLKTQGWVVEKILDGKFSLFIRELPLLPVSVAKLQRFGQSIDLEEIIRVVKQHRVISLTLEPELLSTNDSRQFSQELKQFGFRDSQSPFLPTKTIHVDLSQSIRALRRGLSKDARASIAKAETNHDVRILLSTQLKKLKSFHELWSKHGKGFIPPWQDFFSLLKSFGPSAFVIQTELEDEIAAGAVILMSKEVSYYYFAFTAPRGREYFSGYLLVWKAMMEARRRERSVFDLEGIYDNRFQHLKRWKGFSDFKKKFGGKVITYPGPYSRLFFPWF